MGKYKIGEIAKLSGLSLRTIRYYEEEGLIRAGRSEGGQRFYRDEDLVYLRRIIELKGLGFSLSEIRRIFLLKEEDSSGNKRREALLAEYRRKLDEDRKKMEALQSHIDDRCVMCLLPVQFQMHILHEEREISSWKIS